MKCPICKQAADQLYSSISQGKYVSERCAKCASAAMSIAHAEFARKNERTWQSREYAKDLVQPSDEGFAKAYGADAAKQRGWSDEEIRRLT